MAAQTLEPIELIRRADKESLLDAEWLEFNLLPALGLCPDSPTLYPEALRGAFGGLRSWQYPNQFAPYLVDLAGRGISRYLEIGVRYGGTFIITVEYLKRFNPIAAAVAIDPAHEPQIAAYIAAENHPGYRYINAGSEELSARAIVDALAPYDLALIDGDHSREGFARDWLLVRPHAQIVAVHDVDNDGYPWIREWFQSYQGNKRAYTAQYEGVQGRHAGIGVLYA